MGLVVKKFGGTSVGDVERIRHVARLLKSHIDATGDQVAVVVSAMAGETNKLVALAKSCVENPEPRELDVLLASGEQVTIALLAMALVEIGLPAQSMLGLQAQIHTDTRFNNAQITGIDGTAIKQILAQGKIPVIAGFQGIDEKGDITTLGRGGSDITAVAVAAALKADACYIYTDVKGVYTTDPRICSSAKFIEKVCHEEMLEMASLGAKVLHPRSVYFAMAYEMPLVVLSTFEPGAGTWIVKEEQLVEKPIVTGITYRVDEAKITIQKIPSNPKFLSRLFTAMGDAGIFIDMITQTSLADDLTDISFTVPDEMSGKALEIAQRYAPELGARGADCERDIAKVSVVGVGMRYHTGVAARMFQSLAAEDIEVKMISTSEIKISVIIPRKYYEVAVRTLHDAFHGEKIEVKAER